MAVPTNRTDFKEFCLRQLGKPVINIDLSDEQIEDCIDLALSWYTDYHADATEKTYYKYAPTSTDRTNGYIPIPENIIGVVKVFPIGNPISGSDGLFDIQYQIALNDLYTLTSVSMVPYYMMREHLALLEMMLIGQIPIRYNRHRDRLHLDMNWDKIPEGHYLLIEAYEVLDPATFPDVWKDRWLIRYCTALIKRTWGNATKKFGNMMLPGGISFNGQQIYNEAIDEIREIEQEVMLNYSLPPEMMVG